MEGETRIISSKDILSSEFYEIDMMAVRMSGRWQQDTIPRRGYTILIRQLRRLMYYDILKLSDTEQKDFDIPTCGFELITYDVWEKLHINLTVLARKIGMVGRETAPHGDSLERMFKDAVQ